MDRVSGALLLSDLLALVLTWLFVPIPGAAIVALTLALVATFAANSLYKSRLTLSIFDDLPVIMAAVPAGYGLVALASWDPGHHDGLLVNGALALALLIAGRASTYGVIRFVRARGWVTYRTLVVGSGRTSAMVGRLLDEHPEHGLRVAGFVGPCERSDEEVQSRLVGESPRLMVEAAEEVRAGVVLVVLNDVRAEEILRVLRAVESRLPFTLFVVPQLHELQHRARNERLGHIAVLRVGASAFQAIPRGLKRAFDVVVAAVCITVLAPVLALVAAAVRLDMGPGVLFRQTRIGLGGAPFELYKFRSLRPLNEQESAERWSVHNETRITRLGRFIRKTSLDELPQLFNVLRGDMSLVGPRPERPHFVKEFGRRYEWYPFRHRVRPGLTGWAAVNGLRGDTSIEDRCLYDNAYIDNWTPWLDAKILARTVSAVVRGEGG